MSASRIWACRGSALLGEIQGILARMYASLRKQWKLRTATSISFQLFKDYGNVRIAASSNKLFRFKLNECDIAEKNSLTTLSFNDTEIGVELSCMRADFREEERFNFYRILLAERTIQKK